MASALTSSIASITRLLALHPILKTTREPYNCEFITDVSYGVTGTRVVTARRANQWIGRMKRFTLFIGTIPQTRLLVSLRLPLLMTTTIPLQLASTAKSPGHVVKSSTNNYCIWVKTMQLISLSPGKSFCAYPKPTDRVSAHFVPPDKHGTRIATLICQICARVQ